MEKFQVTFKKVSAGDETMSIGCCIPHDQCTPAKAHGLFLKAQLKVILDRDPNAGKDVAGQGKMPHGEVEQLSGVVEVKGYSCTNKGWNFTMSLPVTAIDYGDMAQLANKRGTLQAEKVGKVEDKRKKKDD